MNYINGIPARTAIAEEKEYLFFSGFAYLGMPALEDFQQLVITGLQEYGVVFPSSRISNTPSLLYQQFEDKLSRFVQKKDSASFSSGYMASQAAVTFASQSSELLYSPFIHPSLVVTGHKISSAAADDWKEQFIHHVNKKGDLACTVVLESVNPLTGSLHDFSWLTQLKRTVRILIDDSHGIGILGEKGEGVVSLLPQNEYLQYLISYSLSKAFSCEGGAVSGTAEDIEGIKKQPYFTASTGMSPALAYAWINSHHLFLKQLQLLRNNIAYFENKIRDLKKINHDYRLPVFYVREEKLYDHCLENKIMLSAFHYPSKDDPLMVRIVLNALHTREDLDTLIDCLHRFYGS